MPKAKDVRVDEAFELYKQGLKLIEIAKRLDIKEGTVRSWKNRGEWDGPKNATLQKKKRNVAKNKDRTIKAVADEVEEVMNNTELTDKQRLFCIYYIRSFNATKAYQKAYGVNYSTAASIGYRLLAKDGVKEEIQRLKQGRLNREFLSEADIFQKYMDIALADITDYLEFGTEEVPVMSMYGPVKEKDPKTGKEVQLKKTVNTVRFRDSSEVDGTILAEVKQGKDGASIKLSDRMKALQWLSDHMDLATEKQKAEIAILKAKVQTEDGEEETDDGFLDALNASAREDWSDEED